MGLAPDIGGNTPIDGLYPGDSYVDWVGMDGYNFGNTQSWSRWVSFNDVFNTNWGHNLYTNLGSVAPSKPIMISETGSSESGGSKADWIRDALQTQLPINFPKIKAIVWFNINKETNWQISSSSTSQTAFATAVANPIYLSNQFGTISQNPIPDLEMVMLPTAEPTIAPTALPTAIPPATPVSAPSAPPSVSVQNLLIEAESMVYPKTTKAYTDNNASGSRALAVYSNATSTKTFSLVNPTQQIIIRARADLCQGSPHFNLVIDGKVVYSTNISTTNWADSLVNVSLPTGNHTLSIIYDNDYSQKRGCDRNLYLDKISITQ